ncbi:hypothetical protein TNCV_2772741 [Trichonephila clavipes]|nr:hypothetical protein TNCV_2772741 [Trichonephila clavipes]
MERVNRDHLQMIITRLGTSSYVNLLIPCEWQFMRPPGRPQQSNVLVKMLITSFQKVAMVSDGAEFAVGKIEKWFKEAKHNTIVKLKK